MMNRHASIEQVIVMKIIRIELEKYDSNDVIPIEHKDPNLGKVNHRVGWLLKKVTKVIEDRGYNDEHSITLNSLRDYFYPELQTHWKRWTISIQK